MNTTSRVIRIATLSLFLLLIGFFVAYRSGYIDLTGARATEMKPLPEAMLANTAGSNATDTIPITDSAKPKPIMYSSKSAPISTQWDFSKPKKEKKKDKKKNRVDSVGTQLPVIMPSSKSGAIFTPKKDTAKKQQ